MSKGIVEIFLTKSNFRYRSSFWIIFKYGVKNFFLRPKSLSHGTTPKIPVIRHALKKAEIYFNNKFDIIFDLDVTSPLRLVSDIKKSYKQFLITKKDLLFSANESRSNPYFNAVIINKKKLSH